MASIVKSEDHSVLSPLFAGFVYAMVVAITSTILISLLLTVTGLREQSLPLYVYMIHGISIFTGGFICAQRAGIKGWYRGGLLGAFYCLFVILIAYLGFHARLDLDTLVFLIICCVIGAFGGILGINAKR
jgi:putative membrane protein (TIGR04086 family)